MTHHETPAENYNPARDYARIMHWLKYGIAIFAAGTIILRVIIG